MALCTEAVVDVGIMRKAKVANLAVYTSFLPGRVAQSVTCLATDAWLTADPGVVSSIPAGPILSWKLIMK